MSRTRRKSAARLGTVAALVAPFLVVQAGRMVFDSQMSQAPASPVTAVPMLYFAADGGQIPLSEPEKAALSWMTRHRSEASGAPLETPMDRTAAKPTPPPADVKPADPEQDPETEPLPEPEPLPGVTVTAIMGPNEARGTEALVFINGKVRRVGDEVSPGWRITAINARDWVVEFTHDDGRVETISREMPE